VLLKQLGMVRQSWAILHEPSDVDKKMWAKRGVEIDDSTLEDFVDGMHRAHTPTRRASRAGA
jgi:hypothetical protein